MSLTDRDRYVALRAVDLANEIIVPLREQVAKLIAERDEARALAERLWAASGKEGTGWPEAQLIASWKVRL